MSDEYMTHDERPVCSKCGEAIEDDGHYFNIDGYILCDDCAYDLYGHYYYPVLGD